MVWCNALLRDLLGQMGAKKLACNSAMCFAAWVITGKYKQFQASATSVPLLPRIYKLRLFAKLTVLPQAFLFSRRQQVLWSSCTYFARMLLVTSLAIVIVMAVNLIATVSLVGTTWTLKFAVYAT